MNLVEISYRCWFKGIPPKTIKLQIPGWAGTPGYSDGCEPQPWHCKPFVDASTYGLELIYPFSNPCIVKNENDKITFDSVFTDEEKSTGMMPPFMSFAPYHYGFTSSLDIKTKPGIITRIEPHPSFYTDRTGTIPTPVAGHIETEWWSRIFFIAFKSPLPGQHHVFSPGQPYAQLLFLPKEINYKIKPMPPEEIAKRSVRDDKINKNSDKLCNHSYTDNKNNVFNNKYKVISKLNQKEGEEGVDQFIKDKTDIKITKKIKSFKIKKHN